MSYVAIHDSKGDGQWHVSADQYEAILHAWESGVSRVSFATMDGADVTVRTDAIHAVVFMSDAAIESVNARHERDRLESA